MMTQIETMSLAELKLVLGWASAEGWNPGLDDAAAFHAADPEGFLLARIGDSRKGTSASARLLPPAAAISVVRHDAHDAFLGLYICHPEYRGQGIGWAVWQACMEKLEGFSIGLDGVVAQQDNYRKSGFEWAYRNIRYAGTPQRLDRPDNNSLSNHQVIQPEHMASIHSLDKKVHGIQRLAFLDHWLQDSHTRHSLVSLHGSQVVGYGTIRACEQGHNVGPLVARDGQQAHSLLSELVKLSSAQSIILDVPEPNSRAVDLAESLGLEAVFQTARMYRGSPPDFQLGKLFGVTTFELG